MVEELENVLEDMGEPDRDITKETILGDSDYAAMVSFAIRYIDVFGDRQQIEYSILEECIEIAIAQYKKKREIDKVIEKMRIEALHASILTTNSSVRSAAEYLMAAWTDSLSDGEISETYDFDYDIEVTTAAIAAWAKEVAPSLRKSFREVEDLRKELTD